MRGTILRQIIQQRRHHPARFLRQLAVAGTGQGPECGILGGEEARKTGSHVIQVRREGCFDRGVTGARFTSQSCQKRFLGDVGMSRRAPVGSVGVKVQCVYPQPLLH